MGEGPAKAPTLEGGAAARENLDAALRRVATRAAVATSAVAVLALVGWATGNLRLASARSDLIPMAPNTAAAFLLIGATLLSGWRRKALPRVVAFGIMAIAAYALMTGQGPGVVGRLGPFPLGVMSPVTAVTFLMTGAALLALSIPPWRALAVASALSVLAVGLLSVLGYAYGTPLLYQGSVIPLALTTGASFLAVGTALLARAGPEAWPVRVLKGTSVRARMTRAFVPTVILVTLVQGWLAILIARGPLENPAVFAAALAVASVPLAAFVVSGLSRKIGDIIERTEERRRQAEESRARFEERERSARAMARQKEDLARLVVHDLKNPLTTIIMGVELMTRRARGDARYAEIAGDVMAAAHAMDRMTLDIIDISRSEDGALVPRLQSVDLPELTARVIKSMRLRTVEREADVLLSSSVTAPEIDADPQLLQRVVENLLDNSLKYAPRGRPIHVELRDSADDMVDMSVRDEGPGVPPEARERVFEKYARLQRDAGRSVRESRGLGLAFCKLAVEAHGGRIWVEENRPVGSRFCLRLHRSLAPSQKVAECESVRRSESAELETAARDSQAETRLTTSI